MRFRNFKEFRPSSFTTLDLEKVSDYLAVEMVLNLRQLNLGLQRLELLDNFESFEETVTIDSGDELAVVNKLDNAIPRHRLIVRSDEGGLSITDGETEWSKDFVYLKNYGGLTGTVTVVFLK